MNQSCTCPLAEASRCGEEVAGSDTLRHQRCGFKSTDKTAKSTKLLVSSRSGNQTSAWKLDSECIEEMPLVTFARFDSELPCVPGVTRQHLEFSIWTTKLTLKHNRIQTRLNTVEQTDARVQFVGFIEHVITVSWETITTIMQRAYCKGRTSGATTAVKPKQLWGPNGVTPTVNRPQSKNATEPKRSSTFLRTTRVDHRTTSDTHDNACSSRRRQLILSQFQRSFVNGDAFCTDPQQ